MVSTFTIISQQRLVRLQLKKAVCRPLFSTAKGRSAKKRRTNKKQKNTRVVKSSSEDSDFEADVATLPEELGPPDLSLPLTVSDFCLVKYITEEDMQVRHSIGRIIQLHHKAFEISFLRKVKKNEEGIFSFVLPIVPDVTTVAEADVVSTVLPLNRTGTARQNRTWQFKLNLPDNFNL